MAVIGEVEVRIIEGNCVDRQKHWREVKTPERSRLWWGIGGEKRFLLYILILLI